MKPVAFREWQIDMNYCLCLDVMSERFFHRLGMKRTYWLQENHV